MKEEIKSEGGGERENKLHFKKKGNQNKGKKQQSTADDVFRGIGFSIQRERPELFSALDDLVCMSILSSKMDPCTDVPKTRKNDPNSIP